MNHNFSYLSPAAAGLGAVFERPRAIAFLCILGLSGLGWTTLGFIAATGANDNWLAAVCNPLGGIDAVAFEWRGLAIVFAMWMAMTLAMMLPTAAPMIVTYSEIADTAARKKERIISPLVLGLGYAAIWLGFALAAAVLQWTALRATGWLGEEYGRFGPWLSAALFLGAGLYQFSTLKHACLHVCQRPFPFFFANWTTRLAGVFALGLRQGLHCLGCCWAMMLLMLATGAMNVLWMAALGIAMTIEKIGHTQRFARMLGIVFIGVGAAFLLNAVLA
jgi:predicted metal-binding membrane protein